MQVDLARPMPDRDRLAFNLYLNQGKAYLAQGQYEMAFERFQLAYLISDDLILESFLGH